MSRRQYLLVALILVVVAFPPGWYPLALRLEISRWFGAAAYLALPVSKPVETVGAEIYCPPDLAGWRSAFEIDGVNVSPSKTCLSDNPYSVATFVRGANNVSDDTLLKSGLAADAVTKGEDLDGDGDPDVIHIRLEVVELNGSSAESAEPVTQYEIAPGITPGLWVFAPKYLGMARENFESRKARSGLRPPSPVIRVEQGDRVVITLENTHYMPHTIHLHGADHGFVTATGQGNDGVPLTSELPLMPGKARSYELTPRQTGTMFYHCHVQPHVHVSMGLQGMFVIEENQPNNWLQTLNVGAGFVRSSSVAIAKKYDQEYDLHYTDLDLQLGQRVQSSNDPRLVTRSMHRDYDVTDATADYFLLNGKSFPYTFRESLIVTEPDEKIKLRVLNGGSKGISFHIHGHKFNLTHKDGVGVVPENQAAQDVIWLPTAQRVDLDLSTRNDGLHSYGAGIWLFHDHQNKGTTTDGIGPGGNISAVVYQEYMGLDGWPKTQGVSYEKFFSAEYYRKIIPVWQSYAPVLFSDPGTDWLMFGRILLLALAAGMSGAVLVSGSK